MRWVYRSINSKLIFVELYLDIANIKIWLALYYKIAYLRLTRKSNATIKTRTNEIPTPENKPMIKLSSLFSTAFICDDVDGDVSSDVSESIKQLAIIYLKYIFFLINNKLWA